uniref:hypothetical protein n=1 Tax=Paraisaria gracilioides TaxID=2651847 RepID=UPI0023D7EA96|nr:hypothetical protein P2Y88_mgp02 [Paraisaria gracilioides]WDE74385.1 hypothetical protein [Paraisaria gracilioides]
MNMKKLNNDIVDLLVGSILGDAHIGLYKYKKVYITFEQTIKHKEYITHIYNILNSTDFNLDVIKYYTRKDSRHNSVNTSIYFKLHSLELLNSLASSFLSKNNKKMSLHTKYSFKYWTVFKSYYNGLLNMWWWSIS